MTSGYKQEQFATSLCKMEPEDEEPKEEETKKKLKA